jgi:hypothetical protein
MISPINCPINCWRIAPSWPLVSSATVFAMASITSSASSYRLCLTCPALRDTRRIVDQFDHHAIKAGTFLIILFVRHECFPFMRGCNGRACTRTFGRPVHWPPSPHARIRYVRRWMNDVAPRRGEISASCFPPLPPKDGNATVAGRGAITSCDAERFWSGRRYSNLDPNLGKLVLYLRPAASVHIETACKQVCSLYVL